MTEQFARSIWESYTGTTTDPDSHVSLEFAKEEIHISKEDFEIEVSFVLTYKGQRIQLSPKLVDIEEIYIPRGTEFLPMDKESWRAR